MAQKIALLRGICIGVAAMYVLDPDHGKRRQAVLRDQVIHQTRRAIVGLGKSGRDLRHRLAGWLNGGHRFHMGTPVPNEVLVARTRAQIGRVTSHPGALHITANDGSVQVSGPILAGEVERTLACMRAVEGVRQVESYLDIHERPEHISALQTGDAPPRLLQRREPRWPPAARLGAIVGGGLLALLGISRRSVVGTITSVIGAGLFVRGSTNASLRRLFGIRARCPAVTLHKTLTVQAPLEQVFALWSHYDLLPQVMQHVRGVQLTNERYSSWIVAGPLGVPLQWQAVVTAYEPNHLIRWQSLPGSPVSQIGTLRFASLHDGVTRLDLHLAYTPPGGMVGDVLATLLGAHVKRMIDQDLVRYQSLMEHGRTKTNGSMVTCEHLFAQIASSGPGLAEPTH
jgi:uncharacterized membrane protein